MRGVKYKLTLQVCKDKNNRLFTWGFGGYGRLGHASPKDEWVPRQVTLFSTPKRGAKMINAGGLYTMATDLLGKEIDVP